MKTKCLFPKKMLGPICTNILYNKRYCKLIELLITIVMTIEIKLILLLLLLLLLLLIIIIK